MKRRATYSDSNNVEFMTEQQQDNLLCELKQLLPPRLGSCFYYYIRSSELLRDIHNIQSLQLHLESIPIYKRKEIFDQFKDWSRHTYSVTEKHYSTIYALLVDTTKMSSVSSLLTTTNSESLTQNHHPQHSHSVSDKCLLSNESLDELITKYSKYCIQNYGNLLVKNGYQVENVNYILILLNGNQLFNQVSHIYDVDEAVTLSYIRYYREIVDYTPSSDNDDGDELMDDYEGIVFIDQENLSKIYFVLNKTKMRVRKIYS